MQAGEFAAGECGQHSVAGEVAQAQAVGGSGEAGVRVVPFANLEGGLEVAVLIQDVQVARGEELLEVAQAGLDPAEVRQGMVGECGQVVVEWQRVVLGKEADASGRDDRTVGWRLDAGRDPQQRRLAGAVLADQAADLSRWEGAGELVEHQTVVVGLGEVVQGQLGRHRDPPDARGVRVRNGRGQKITAASTNATTVALR